MDQTTKPLIKHKAVDGGGDVYDRLTFPTGTSSLMEKVSCPTQTNRSTLTLTLT